MKKQLEKQIQQIAELINKVEEGDTNVDALIGLEELLDMLSNKIKSSKLGGLLDSQPAYLESVRHEAIFIFDRSLKVYKYTGMFDQLFHPQKEGALKVSDLLKFENDKAFLDKIEELLKKQTNQTFDATIYSSQGVPLPATISLELLGSKKGDELIVGGVNFQNTTLTDIKNYQQLVIENLPDIDVYLFDSDYRYVLAGGREKERFGLSNSYFPGKTLFEAFEDKINRRLFPFYRKALNGEMAEGEFRVEDQIYYIWVTPVPNFYNEVVGGTAIVQNVTKDKEIEIRLKKAKDDAQRADKAKSLFLANMSHEIRTPLNAIIGFAEQLSQSQMNREQDRFVQFISDSSEHLLSLVNEILILFKIGMGKVHIDRVPFNLTQLLNVIYNSFIIKANEKQLQLSIQVDPGIPETLVGDPFRLRQIITNLVANAIKYTDEGAVVLRCFLLEKDELTYHLKFEVEDTGMGISSALIPKIFDEFTQSEAQPDKKRKGAGLGLTICRKLVDLMDGHIDVESELGQGSCFSVLLPFYHPSDEKQAESESHFLLSESLLKGKKILFADDDEYNLLLAETVLGNWEASYMLAANGEEALNLAKTNLFDILLLDIHMPRMSGVEVVQEIKSDPKNPNLNTKVLAVTANVLQSDLKVYMQEGFDGYVLKPFKEKELYNKICNVLQLGEVSGTESMWEDPRQVKEQEGDGFDVSNLRKTANGDRAFFNKMIDTFVRNAEELRIDLEQKLDERDWNEIGERAHRAIPSFKYFELNALVKKLRRLEDLALREKSFDALPNEIREVLRMVDQAIDEAKKTTT